jgi:hypothetical protein
MSYMLMVVEPRGQRKERPDAQGRAVYDRMVRFTQDLQARGLLMAADSLKSDTQGARLAIRGGKRTVVDGPFAEAKEMVGGFFLLNCRTKEEALAIAGECPAAEWATIEVRESGPCYD